MLKINCVWEGGGGCIVDTKAMLEAVSTAFQRSLQTGLSDNMSKRKEVTATQLGQKIVL